MSKRFIKELEKISLSSNDMLNFIDGRANLVMYPDIKNYKNIDELLGPYGACIILYLTKEDVGLYGHWCCIFKQDKNTIHFFDPYGDPVDSALDYDMPDYFRLKYGLYIPLLSYLLYNAYDKYDIRYNEFPFQEEKRNVNSCGRHCLIRILLRDLDEYQYEDFMKSTKYNPDELVTLLTQDIDTEDL